MSDPMMKTIDDAIAEIFRLRADLAKAEADRDAANERCAAAVDDYNDAQAMSAEMAKALEPFSQYGNWTDEIGWTDEAPHRDPLSYWLGPSDFRNAAAAFASHRKESEQ
jgi:hypothetical protein